MPTFCDPCPGKRNASLPTTRPPSPLRLWRSISASRRREQSVSVLHQFEEETRGAVGIVEDRLPYRPQVARAVRSKQRAGVRVAIEPRERATRDREPDAVACRED